MAAATVIHFGHDERNRIRALRDAGYEVREPDSLDALRQELEREDAVHTVMVSEGARRITAIAADLVRQHCGAPLILFRRSKAALDSSRFDRVYSPVVPEAKWLFETAVLVEQGRALLAETERLRGETEAVRAGNHGAAA